MRRSLLVMSVLAILVTACGSSGSPKAAPTASTSATTAAATPTTTSTVRIVETAPPAGISAPKAQWLRVTRADGKRQLAAVYRPSGTGGPHPVVVLFHGASGLATVQLAWAAKLSSKGYIVVAGCYLDAASGSAPDAFLPCPGLPDVTHATVANVRPSYRTLLDVAASLEGVETGAIGVVGMSLGANVVLGGDDARIKAIVADSGYRETPGTTSGPVLLLGFTNDPNVAHSKLVAFERAQLATNPVESHYYPGAGHVALLTPTAASDATARTVAFLQQHLR
jgi:dienelactone hydrolase